MGFHVDFLQAFHVDLLLACSKAKNAAKSTLLLTCKWHGLTMCSIVLYWTVTNLILDRNKGRYPSPNYNAALDYKSSKARATL